MASPPTAVLDAIAALIDAVPAPDPSTPQDDEATFHFPAVRRETIDGVEMDVVDMRELHASLGVVNHFSGWRSERITVFGPEDRCADYGFFPNRRTGSEVEWLVTLGTAKELAMLERNAVGRANRRYFIRCEERLQAEHASAAAEETARLRAEIELLRRDAGSRDREARDGEEPSLIDVIARFVDVPGMTPGLLLRITDLPRTPSTRSSAGKADPVATKAAAAPGK